MEYIKDSECRLLILAGLSAYIWVFSILITATEVIHYVNTDTNYTNKENY